MNKPGAKEIAEARMAEIERRQAELKEKYPELFNDAQNFKNEFGYCRVKNVRAL